MQVPLEITYRGLEKTQAIDDLVREKSAKLEKFCDHLISCRVAIEKTQENAQSGGAFRVRVDMRIPPHHELVAKHTPDRGGAQVDLYQIIRDTFSAAERQLKELVERQQGEVKSHPTNEFNGVVDKRPNSRMV